MKNIFLSMLFFSITLLNAQDLTEKQIVSDVNEVTVYIEGAQVTRKKTVDILPGKTLLKFINLSPFIDAKSVQVKANGNLTVLAVNHHQNFMDKLDKPKELIDLENKLDLITEKIKLENTHLAILKEELIFLQENRNIGGKNQELNVTNLKDAAAFYNTRLTAIKLKEIERNAALKMLNKQNEEVQKQINTLSSKKDFANGEVHVKIDSKKNERASFEISYIVSNTGWYPSYDIRATNINEPIQLIYKANVKQDTKEDWKNIKLKFSTAKPNVSGVAPELKTYFLNYNISPPVYGKSISLVKGKVSDSYGVLPGVSVNIVGTTIGTVTDFEGNYSITIPNNADSLKFSYVGMETQTVPISNPIINVVLNESATSLEEVVITAYGTSKKQKYNDKEEVKVNLKAVNNTSIPTAQISKQTTVDYEIKIPYTINSDNKNYTIDMDALSLDAFYQYYSVPKVDKSAFLLAQITDWEKYNLLEGEASIFFEDTYVGKSLLDTRFATDTLQISLGRDKNISIQREKIKNYTTKQFIGTKKEEFRAWKTTVKNNKNQPINIMVLDQVPISTNEEIELKIKELSNAIHILETGTLKWGFKLDSNTKKELDIIYSVRYPKNRNLLIE